MTSQQTPGWVFLPLLNQSWQLTVSKGETLLRGKQYDLPPEKVDFALQTYIAGVRNWQELYSHIVACFFLEGGRGQNFLRVEGVC